LIGTFIVFPLLGFSINTLRCLGWCWLSAWFVDDAIVVVEGVQRHIEEGLAPKEAARKAMDELSGPSLASRWFCRRSLCRQLSSRASREGCISSSR